MVIKLLDKISTILAREAYEANWVSLLSQGLSGSILSASQGWFVGVAAAEEIQAKIHAFGCFRNLDAGETQHELQDWPKCVKATRAHDPCTSMWLLEGWATRVIDSHFKTNLDLPWLAVSGAGKEMLSASRLALHTGAGMSFARFTLSRWTVNAQEPSLGAVIEEFLEVAGERALPNYRRCLVEPLGLVVRTLYSQLTSPISRLLYARSREDCALFWHGSGRGLYFSPLQMVPSVRLRNWSLDEAVSNAPGVEARANLLSGFFWAMTLVNIRHPEVITYFLGGRPIEHWEPDVAAISDGVSAALLVWHHLTGDHATTEHFLGHVPSDARERLRRFWEDQIVSLSYRRLTHEYDRLRRDDRIADIFRFQGQ